jgi:predicted  nucleic acid-binding Zn-ribbon protein
MAINIPIVSEFNNAGLKKAQREFQRLEKTSQKVGFALKKAFVPATAALGGLAVAGAKMVAAGEQAATANARIEQIATSMGLFGDQTGKVTDRLVKLANEQARLTGVNQNTIKESQALLLTFKDIASSADEVGGAFDRATQLTLDMASAGFGSVTDNAKQLGKALNDPIAGLTALRRSGIQFTEAQQDQIRTLVESGQVLEAQNMILEEIENQVGGTAEATANSTDKMKVAFSQASESIGMALLPAVEALVPMLIKFSDFAAENKDIIIIAAGAIGGLSAAIVVANIGMKIYTATTAIATAAQWAFNTAVGAVVLPVVAVAAFTGALIALERASDKASRTFRILLPGINGLSDAISWLEKKTKGVNEEWENFNQTIDETRKEAGNMYPELDNTAKSVEDLINEAIDATKAQLDLAGSINDVFQEVKKLNPALEDMLALLDREDQIENFERAIDNYRDALIDSELTTREQDQALRDLQRELINTLDAFNLLTDAFAKGLKIKFDAGNIEAAISSARRVIDAYNQVRAVVEGRAPASTYIPSPAFEERITTGGLAGPMASTTITPVASITRAPTGAVQNVTVNVSTINPTAEVGEAVVTAIRNYNRTSGSAQIGVSRL